MEKKYTVTEKELRAFYDAKGKLADKLYEVLAPPFDSRYEMFWDDNVGPSFEFLLESLRLRNGDEEE